MSAMFGVYRVRKNGTHVYLSRSATQSESLARDIAEGLTRGEVVLPTGAIKRVRPAPHIHKPINSNN